MLPRADVQDTRRKAMACRALLPLWAGWMGACWAFGLACTGRAIRHWAAGLSMLFYSAGFEKASRR